MRKFGRYVIAVVGTGLLAISLAMTVFGATKKGISAVSLSFETEIFPGDELDPDSVVITTKSDNYYIGDQEFSNPVFRWESTDIPELVITLHAADGYRFSLTDAKSVKLSGGGVKYKGAKKKDNWDTLELTVTFTPLSESVAEIEDAKWSSTGMASWSTAQGAGGYEVKLYRNGSSVGSSKVTADTFYDFSSIMTKPASYIFKVRAVNAVNNTVKSDWAESVIVSIDENQAALFRSGVTASGWKQGTSGSWWYQNQDGSYTTNNWQMIGDKWYFFDETGYMKTGWIEWEGKSYFCTEDGDMLVNTTTPDGYSVDASGIRIN